MSGDDMDMEVRGVECGVWRARVRRKRLMVGIGAAAGKVCPPESVASTIVRNLYNVKGFPRKPGLTCLKSTGAPRKTRTSSATHSIKGKRSASASADATMSK